MCPFVYIKYIYSSGEILDYCYAIVSFAYTKTKMVDFNLKLPIFEALLLAIKPKWVVKYDNAGKELAIQGNVF